MDWCQVLHEAGRRCWVGWGRGFQRLDGLLSYLPVCTACVNGRLGAGLATYQPALVQ